MNWNFSSLGLIPDLVNQIPRGSTSLNNSPGPIGSTAIGHQMEAIAWGAMTGMPVVGLPMAGIAYAYGAQADPLAGAVTYAATGAALYYFAPRTAGALGEIMAYGVLRTLGFRLAGPTWRVLFTEAAYTGGRHTPLWAWALIGYGAYKYVQWLAPDVYHDHPDHPDHD